MRGVITLTFDDGYEAVYTHVVPLLSKYKIPAVFAVPLETGTLVHSTGQPMKPWLDWLPLQQHGHEIAAHSIGHTDLRKLSREALEEELRLPHEKLSATTLVYPGGAVDDRVMAATKQYYSAARTTRYGFERRAPKNPWALRTIDYTQDNWSLSKANSRAVWAWLTNRWLIETYHLVDISDSSLHHSVPFAEFKKHIEFIRQLPIEIKTIHEIISRSHY